MEGIKWTPGPAPKPSRRRRRGSTPEEIKAFFGEKNIHYFAEESAQADEEEA